MALGNDEQFITKEGIHEIALKGQSLLAAGFTPRDIMLGALAVFLSLYNPKKLVQRRSSGLVDKIASTIEVWCASIDLLEEEEQEKGTE